MLVWRVLFLALCLSVALAIEIPALHIIWRAFGFGSNVTNDELGQSRGQCHYNFHNFIQYRDRMQCQLDDVYITHLLPTYNNEVVRKPPIMVRCLQDASVNTTTNNELQLMKSVNDIVTLLQPVGNATKRHEPGSCVLVIFYSPTSYGCSRFAYNANALPHLFPTLRLAAIDAFEFPSFNTEFGIVGLPTLLLFHQGRPVIKYYSEESTLSSFSGFIMLHTGITPLYTPIKLADVKQILPIHVVEETDYILLLAWAFILLCVGNYFAKSNACRQLIETIKRNWRESEAQLEPN